MFAAVSTEKQYDVRTAIISMLAKSPRLGAKEVYKHMLREYYYRISYQGVHKALSQLTFKDVLRKSGAKYILSEEWITSVKEFISDVESACFYKRPMSILELPEYGAINVKNEGMVIEPYLWMLEQARKVRLATSEPLNAVCFQRRSWPLMVLGKDHYNQFKSTFQDKEQYILVHESQPLDQYLSVLWAQEGFRCRLGIPCAEKNETFVCGDFVFQIFHPEKTKREWDKFYEFLDKTGTKGFIAAHKIAFETRTPSEFIVTRNAEFAEQIRAQARAYFKSPGRVRR